jgi:hypothetical protein
MALFQLEQGQHRTRFRNLLIPRPLRLFAGLWGGMNAKKIVQVALMAPLERAFCTLAEAWTTPGNLTLHLHVSILTLPK